MLSICTSDYTFICVFLVLFNWITASAKIWLSEPNSFITTYSLVKALSTWKMGVLEFCFNPVLSTLTFILDLLSSRFFNASCWFLCKTGPTQNKLRWSRKTREVTYEFASKRDEKSIRTSNNSSAKMKRTIMTGSFYFFSCTWQQYPSRVVSVHNESISKSWSLNHSEIKARATEPHLKFLMYRDITNIPFLFYEQLRPNQGCR